ncbi:MAG: hypothetical protein RI885_2117 [Actinomycetota bacterium]|jgi:hypothetical protein
MADRFKPIFESLSEAAVRGARHADTRLPQLTSNHSDQIDLFKGKTRDLDVYDGPGSPSRPRPRPDGGADTQAPRPETLDAEGNIDWSHAPHDGFRLDEDGTPITQEHVPQSGDRFDRFGHPGGRFVSPVPEGGPFSYDSRSLPYQENPNAYHQYEWVYSPADVQSVYDGLDDQARATVDDQLAAYGLDVGDLGSVTRGEAAAIPAWDTPGGATQDLLPVSVKLLDIMGMIREV